jgi:DNA-binding beta-propeller fold protein YncE
LSVVVDSKEHRAYVGTSHGVIVVNTAAATSRRLLDHGARDDIALDRGTGLAYVLEGRTARATPQIVVLRGATVTARIRLPASSTPTSITVNSHTHLVYVTHATTPDVTVIKGKGVVAEVHVAKLQSAGPVDAASGNVYLPEFERGKVYILHGAKLRATLTVGDHPTAIALDTTRSLAYVVDSGSSAVSEIHGDTHFTVHTVKMPGKPGDIAVNPTTHLAYVGFPDQTTGLTVLDGATIKAKLDVGSYAYRAGIDEATGLVLVPTESGKIGLVTGDTFLGTTPGNDDGTFGIAFDTLNGRAVVTDLDGKTVQLLQTQD